jgi:serine/threonine-protein kinase
LENPQESAEESVATEASMIGSLFAERYRLLELLGERETSSVYKAMHEAMDRVVAIKIIPAEFTGDDMVLARFEREAQAVGKLNHANVIAVHDVGTDPESRAAYLIMDYIDGENLGQAIAKEGQIGVLRCLPIFLQICGALEHAHQAGIVHRNLKPNNIMLVTQGDLEDFVKVIDFGLAKLFSDTHPAVTLTTPGEMLGDSTYISPEQAYGEPIDARSDIYSLGCVLYEALTGKQPFTGKTSLEVARRHRFERPRSFAEVRPDLYIPDWLETIVSKAMAKDKAERFQSMQEFFDALLIGSNQGNSDLQNRRLSTSLRTAGLSDEPSGTMPALKVIRPRPIWVPLAIIAAVMFITLCLIVAFNHSPSTNSDQPESKQHSFLNSDKRHIA